MDPAHPNPPPTPPTNPDQDLDVEEDTRRAHSSVAALVAADRDDPTTPAHLDIPLVPFEPEDAAGGDPGAGR